MNEHSEMVVEFSQRWLKRSQANDEILIIWIKYPEEMLLEESRLKENIKNRSSDLSLCPSFLIAQFLLHHLMFNKNSYLKNMLRRPS